MQTASTRARRATPYGFTLGLLAVALAAACGGGSSDPEDPGTEQPTCSPHTFSLRSLDGFQRCCEGGPQAPLGESLASCDAPSEDEAPTGAAGAGGASNAAGLGGASLLGGSASVLPASWVVLTHAFEADWESGSDVCLHMTSTGDAVAGEVTLFTMGSAAECAVPAEARRLSFRATEGATAYVCLNKNGPLLETPGSRGALAVAFRFNEGSAESLRIDAIDVKKNVCEP